jgi:hypothetical protein
MQVAELTDLMQLGKQSPQAAAAGLQPLAHTAQPESEVSEGPAAAVLAPEQVGLPITVADAQTQQPTSAVHQTVSAALRQVSSGIVSS